MPHVSDFTQDQDKIIYDLINHDNETNFTPAEVMLGAIRQSGNRVAMTLSGVPGSGYGSTVDVNYTRIKIQDFFDLMFPQGLTLQEGNHTRISDLLPQINAGLGTAITADAINDAPFAPWEGTPNETQTLTLVIRPSHKVYEGQVQLTLDGNDIPLSDVIAVTILDGLNLPQAKVELSSLFTTNVLDGF